MSDPHHTPGRANPAPTPQRPPHPVTLPPSEPTTAPPHGARRPAARLTWLGPHGASLDPVDPADDGLSPLLASAPSPATFQVTSPYPVVPSASTRPDTSRTPVEPDDAPSARTRPAPPTTPSPPPAPTPATAPGPGPRSSPAAPAPARAPDKPTPPTPPPSPAPPRGPAAPSATRAATVTPVPPTSPPSSTSLTSATLSASRATPAAPAAPTPAPSSVPASPARSPLAPASRAPHGPAAPPAAAPAREQAPRGAERFVARAAAVTAILTACGALFGLVRDQTIARLFGATGATDAFLVAWTVPEVAATLLIEDAMALVLIPAFSLALSRRQAAPAPDVEPERSQGAGDPVRALVAATAPRLCAALACAALLLALAAPWCVDLLAPGLTHPALAVDCTRLTALTVLTFGVAGYLSAALRAHRSFVPPAAIYVAYNLAIIGTVLAVGDPWGVRAAALGVAAGSVLMILVQLPSFSRTVAVWPRARDRPRPRLRPFLARRGVARLRGAAVPLGLAVLAPVALFTLTRQAQVLVERFVASSLPPGAISHLNYAQKIAQVPMVLSLMICTVTFPLVARAMADGERERARRRVERDLYLAGLVVLVGAAYVVGYAPTLVELLFQRGAFDADDTSVTASVMRVYAVGLLGHSLTGALVRPFFSVARPTWYPALAMLGGLLLTTAVGVATARHWGVYGIALANALGITTTAALLLHGLSRRMIPLDVRRLGAGLGRLVAAAAVASAVGAVAAHLATASLAAAAYGLCLVPTVFAAAALVLRAPEVADLLGSAGGAARRAAARAARRLPGRADRTPAHSDTPPDSHPGDGLDGHHLGGHRDDPHRRSAPRAAGANPGRAPRHTDRPRPAPRARPVRDDAAPRPPRRTDPDDH
ncbi:lipid II flippase MurJ [Streptomyces buecherae]|uniref:murein biosynthesis integral membrane protein MurJ n=1 Tax=Streptomyces buecherae TaxID=2763006 RepID=UPI0036951573